MIEEEILKIAKDNGITIKEGMISQKDYWKLQDMIKSQERSGKKMEDIKPLGTVVSDVLNNLDRKQGNT